LPYSIVVNQTEDFEAEVSLIEDESKRSFGHYTFFNVSKVSSTDVPGYISSYVNLTFFLSSIKGVFLKEAQYYFMRNVTSFDSLEDFSSSAEEETFNEETEESDILGADDETRNGTIKLNTTNPEAKVKQSSANE